MAKADRPNQLRMRCPHCGQMAFVRNSVELSPLLKELYFVCRNLECGHIFVARLEPCRTVSPSAIPNPEISLPFSAHVRADVLIRQLEMFKEP